MESQQIFININTKTKCLINRFNERKTKIIDIIKTNKNMTKTSKTDLNKLLEEIENLFKEQNNLLLEENKSKQRIIELQTNTQTITKSKSFAEILKQDNNNVIKNKKTSHVITVYPKNEGMTSEDIKKEIKTKLNPIDLKIGINKIKNISRNGLIIECDSQNDCELLKNEINTKISDDCEAKIPIKKKPKIIVYNVPKLIDNENIINNIIKQNNSLNQIINEENIDQNLKFKFSLNAKNPNLQHLIFETSPEVRKLIINSNYLNIEWNRCKCADFISIIRCYNCFGFGHFKRDCTAESHCSHCASTDHNHQSCNKNYKKCINCEKFNSKIKNPNIKPLNTNHDCLNKSCPTYEFVKNKVLEKTDYGL